MELDFYRKLGWKHFAAAALIIILALGFQEYLLAAALTFLTGVVGLAVNEYDLRFAGIELATFSTVLLGYQLGPVPGAVAGLGLVILQMALGQQMGLYAVWVVPTYAVLGFAAGSTTMPVSEFGPVAIIAMHIVWTGFTGYFRPGGVGGYLPYAVGNTLLNVLLFTAVAPKLII